MLLGGGKTKLIHLLIRSRTGNLPREMEKMKAGAEGFLVEIRPLGGHISPMFRREIAFKLMESLEEDPVVFLRGPRQAGENHFGRKPE